MIQIATEDHVQGFRAVHKSYRPSTVTYVDPDDIIHIECYTDPDTNKDFILWDEIQQAFEEAQFVRNKTKMLPYLKGSDYRPLEPRRIAAVPGVVLDVVVGGELEAMTKVISPHQQFFPEGLPMPTPPPQKEHIPAQIVPVYNTDRAPVPVSSPPPPMSHSPNVDYSLKVPLSHMPGSLPDQRYNSDRPTEDPSSGTYRPADLLAPLPESTSPGVTNKKPLLQGLPSDKSVRPALMAQPAEPYKRSHNPQDHTSNDLYKLLHRPQDITSTDPQDHTSNDLYKLLHNPQDLTSTDPHKRPHNPQYHTSTDPTNLSPVMTNASRGDMDAQVALGDMYRDGRGVAQDYRTSVDWYLKAAEQGHVVAQANVGAAYEQGPFQGLGVAQDDERALKWSSRAAQHGSTSAQHLMGMLHEHGRGVPQDDFKAITWYLRAARQQHIDAQRKVAEMYEEGRGAPKDQTRAVEWYLKAASQGHERSQYLVGNAYMEGKGVEKDSSKAVEWYLKAAAQGHIQSQGKIAEAYERGEGVPKDLSKAMEWYNKARNTGFLSKKTIGAV
ncbi:hypothetical protein BGZ95_002717 [Linnemannia exigua]|uniref:HCP-like protein n=1 Tax=Linnemannia exigua TaxID=604196 RepID=A0AAD4DIK4_9FUNG|nr:hypothetical protein BGZ95_002717 [Linnemannia exigua]